MSEMLKTLLYLSLCGTALGLALAIVQRLVGRRLPSRFYYFAWLVVLARFALPIPGLVATERTTAEPATTTVSQPLRMAQLPTVHEDRADTPMLYDDTEPMTAETVAAAASEPTSQPETASAQAEVEPRAPFTMPGWAPAAVWALGALGSAAWYIRGYRRFTRRVRKTLLLPRASDERVYHAIAARRRPALMRSDAVATPMLFGIFRPVIVLPNEDYDSETLRMLLAHELTHHRCGDIAIKWLSAAVYCLHWFNPFMLLIRRRLDECCELSCDERLLRGMDTGQRQAYGNALLAMADSASVGAAVLATSFATEKRTLKERLEQIMKYKTRKGLVLILALAAAMLLCACTVAIGPKGEKTTLDIAVDVSAPETESETLPPQTSGERSVASGEAGGEFWRVTVEVTKPEGDRSVTVSTVDELLAAIAPGNEVHLQPGVYELDKASDYGQARVGGYYTWEPVHDGYELVISDVAGLTLGCEGDDDTAELRTLPRYADVLAFEGCEDIFINDLVIGHTEGAGSCTGSVVSLSYTNDVDIARCGLYGCGVIGLEASGCLNVQVRESDIYECSRSVAALTNCRDIAMVDCKFYDCGGEDNSYGSLLELISCYEVDIINSEIYNNRAVQMISANYSKRVMLLGCAAYGNEFTRGLLGLTRAELIVDVSSFADVGDGSLIAAANLHGDVSGAATGTICNIEGEALTSDDLRAMERGEYTYNGVSVPPEIVAVDVETDENGRHYVTVSNVDEFLAAIAPNTTIRMEAGEYDLSDAEYYGVPVSEYYGWTLGYYDGPQLVISGVDALTIEGAGAENTTLLAEPRLAEIIHFYNCEDLTVYGLTAGHVKAPEGCGAGLLGFEDCRRVDVAECGLFGCGVRGVTAENCIDLIVHDTEIYDCSQNAASITSCENVSFENCDIHDCNSNDIYVFTSQNVTQDGKNLTA